MLLGLNGRLHLRALILQFDNEEQIKTSQSFLQKHQGYANTIRGYRDDGTPIPHTMTIINSHARFQKFMYYQPSHDQVMLAFLIPILAHDMSANKLDKMLINYQLPV